MTHHAHDTRPDDFGPHPHIGWIVDLHVSEAAILHDTRSVLVHASQASLSELGRFDERIAAHLDGIAVAGDFGRERSRAAQQDPGAGELFMGTAVALESADQDMLRQLMALAAARPSAQRGAFAAFGWVSGNRLRTLVPRLLSTADPLWREIGLAACVMHRLEPGAALEAAMTATDARLRARALRSAGECQRRDLLPACLEALCDDNAQCAFLAARSAVLMGERTRSLEALSKLVLDDAQAHDGAALRLALMFLDASEGLALLKRVAQNRNDRRMMLRGLGAMGDVRHIDWLIGQMSDPRLARLAGESFALVTGCDIAREKLDREPLAPAMLTGSEAVPATASGDLDGSPPDGFEAGGSQDAPPAERESDEDTDLPWPDEQSIRTWWETRRARFQPNARLLLGEVVTPAHCRRVLAVGRQGHRRMAAEYLCALQRDKTLFPISAPTWRQRRWLEQEV
ncbi:hypothetical protein [Caballeronia sp. J97]|uniref:hypothetical protein n=1 Tax=Caballeronia sp. J97 TaxID=2805429 RepID=UPI002AB200B8|nr:hypothetical protein [Caballeronia sp. J97]